VKRVFCAAITSRIAGVDQLGQGLDVDEGFLLLRVGEGGNDGIDRIRAERDQLLQGLLRRRTARIAAGFDIGNEPISAIVGE
jgi:hypothetical protein